MIEETARATVLTFMPPAVDPGAPPISIRMMISVRLSAGSSPISTELNPAVRAVTD